MAITSRPGVAHDLKPKTPFPGLSPMRNARHPAADAHATTSAETPATADQDSQSRRERFIGE